MKGRQKQRLWWRWRLRAAPPKLGSARKIAESLAARDPPVRAVCAHVLAASVARYTDARVCVRFVSSGVRSVRCGVFRARVTGAVSEQSHTAEMCA